jgi:hypothetical protein
MNSFIATLIAFSIPSVALAQTDYHQGYSEGRSSCGIIWECSAEVTLEGGPGRLEYKNLTRQGESKEDAKKDLNNALKKPLESLGYKRHGLGYGKKVLHITQLDCKVLNL